jgi:TatD DNase family protein
MMREDDDGDSSGQESQLPAKMKVLHKIPTAAMIVLPFDAHNHVHLGSASPSVALTDTLSGMAVMSTHPRDFPIVIDMARAESEKVVIPCLGIHPWFLHELTDNDLEQHGENSLPQWVVNMQSLLDSDPTLVVGEIGLDNFHFDPTTKDLTSSMETQIIAVEHQLSLATKYQRPVSLHCVRAMGKLMDAITNTQKNFSGRLPPRIYFHAFGGKAATVTQIVRTLEKKKATKVYFGFAPLVNFESKKTIDVIQAVGLERLVLETDHEEADLVQPSMKLGLELIAKTLNVSEEELIRITNRNVQDLYGNCWPTEKKLLGDTLEEAA